MHHFIGTQQLVCVLAAEASDVIVNNSTDYLISTEVYTVHFARGHFAQHICLITEMYFLHVGSIYNRTGHHLTAKFIPQHFAT